ncbi:hypothetical protein V8C35DRAFT_316826 [Trichoderma chlorosporum]
MKGYGEDDDVLYAGAYPVVLLDIPDVDGIPDETDSDYDERDLVEEKSEEIHFKEQTWEQQWREVMRDLVSGKAKWDESIEGQSRLLEEYKKKALTSRDARERTTPTFLHTLARRRDTDDFESLPEDTQLRIITYLLQNQESVSADVDRSEAKEDPILRVAMEFNNAKFIKFIIHCSVALPGKLNELLKATDHEEMNCLHYAFKEQLPKAMGTIPVAKQGVSVAAKRPNLEITIRMIHSFVKDAAPETITSRDNHGNTPIHYALDYRNCRLQSATYGNIVQYLVLKGDKVLKKRVSHQFNFDNQSPYLYFLHTREKCPEHKQPPVTKSAATAPMEKRDRFSGKEPKGVIRTKDTALDESTKDTDDENAKAEHQRKALPPKPGMVEASRTQMPPPPLPEKGRILNHELRETKPGTDDADDGPRQQSRRASVHNSQVQIAREDPDSLVPVANATPKPLTRSQTQNHDQNMDSAQTKVSSNVMSNEKKSQQNTKSLVSDAAAFEIGEFVKVHYIRTRTDMEAKELLYGKVASDKNLYFDASHLVGKPVEQVVDLIEKLSKAGGFEDTLSYVNLPILSTIHRKTTAKSEQKTYNSNEKRQRGGGQQENPNLGRNALISVFDTLVSAKVRRILRLQVEDRDSLPHTDASIERAIRGKDSLSLGDDRDEAIKIEYWDWRKPDLNMDIISFAAPDVTHVNLYWSGNQTVLRGWGHAEGIPLYSTTQSKLKKVTLHAYHGFESRERTKKMIADFENKVKIGTKEKINIESITYSGVVTSNVNPGDDLGTSDIGISDGAPQQVWIERMEDFRSALMSIHRSLKNSIEIPRVKVALIDDGVDLLNLDTYNMVQATGLSYFPPDGKTERPWHQSTNGHGTVMANMIVRINPWVSLDVMKIHNSIGGKVRTIYAESAAKAIEGAIIRKADIISMSWTIRKLAKKPSNAPGFGVGEEHKVSPEEVAMEKLHMAIEHAKKHNILMFCSAADDIQLLGRDSLPFSAAPDCIFRIGAALPKGQRDPTSEDVKTISYFFPGNQVAEAKNPRSSKPIEYHDGSSVSTALAAGLASLIIHCTNVLKNYGNSKVFAEWSLKLRNHTNMRRAFDNINSPHENYDDRKFLHVWKMFGDATDRINKAETKDDKISELETLVRELCNQLRAD